MYILIHRPYLPFFLCYFYYKVHNSNAFKEQSVCILFVCLFFFSLSLLIYWVVLVMWLFRLFVCYHIRWLVRSVEFESHNEEKKKQGKELVTSFFDLHLTSGTSSSNNNNEGTEKDYTESICLLRKCKPMKESNRIQMANKSGDSVRIDRKRKLKSSILCWFVDK